MPCEHTAEFRFYEELNDFLPAERRKQTLEYGFNAHPSVKDAIEAQGIPHTEVELILVNGESVGFDYHLQGGDRVAVYPMFESFDITPLLKLRESPLRNSAFVLDVNLGKLAPAILIMRQSIEILVVIPAGMQESSHRDVKLGLANHI